MRFIETRNGYNINFNGSYYVVSDSKGKTVFKHEILNYCQQWCDKN